jgi:hypothetical protein
VLDELGADAVLVELVEVEAGVEDVAEDPEHPASTPALSARRSANPWRRRSWCPNTGIPS